MFKNIKTRKALVIVILAAIAGFISAKYMAQGNPLVTIPWGVLAFGTAFVAANKREALTLGSCVGLVASYSYLWFDHTGALTAAKVAFLILLILLPALFGLVCGLLCAWLGWVLKTKS